MISLTRRKLAIAGGLGLAGAVSAALLSSPSTAKGPQGMLGSITGNDPNGYKRFATWLGRKPELAVLFFNQTGPQQLADSISYECTQAVQFMAAGAAIYWSVPVPGSSQLEAIVAGTHDALYRRLFAQIVATEPAGTKPILVRLPWEFNIAEQQNVARDRNGHYDAPLFIAAWQHLAVLARKASPRIHRVWCPNVARHAIDPALCWPGAEYVEIVAQDVYLQSRFDPPGTFYWFLNCDRGLNWGLNFARQYGKPYGLSEWGMDSDRYAADLVAAGRWINGLGEAIHHQCWWDRPEVIDARISDGTNPLLGRAYREEFGT